RPDPRRHPDTFEASMIRLLWGATLVAAAAVMPTADSDATKDGRGEAADRPGQPSERQPLFEGLGPHGRKVTTASAEAQRYFDQGLSFLYAFNHDEAIRSFRQAAELDPACAMAWWGVAIANGPHINRPVVDEAHARAALEALAKAREGVAGSTEVE